MTLGHRDFKIAEHLQKVAQIQWHKSSNIHKANPTSVVHSSIAEMESLGIFIKLLQQEQ